MNTSNPERSSRIAPGSTLKKVSAHKRLLIVGATGAIGQILVMMLNEEKREFLAVTRHRTESTLGFNDIFDRQATEFDLIVDCSTASLNDYLRLYAWLESSSDTELLHFSSVRAFSTNSRDLYANYKRSVLSILTQLQKRLIVIKGDLFSFESALVGYWQFVDDLSSWRLFSHRKLSVIDLRELSTYLLGPKVWPTEISRKNTQILRNLDKAVDQKIIPSWAAYLLFQARANRLLMFGRSTIIV